MNLEKMLDMELGYPGKPIWRFAHRYGIDTAPGLVIACDDQLAAGEVVRIASRMADGCEWVEVYVTDCGLLCAMHVGGKRIMSELPTATRGR